MSQKNKVEHLFRHEYGKIVALLVRRFSIDRIDIIEDAVQWSLAQALEFWCKSEMPTNPSAWLYQVANRYLLSELRSAKRKSELLTEQFELKDEQENQPPIIPLSGELGDSFLRMLFVACDNSVPVESQLVFTLKTLCGFSVREISLRLFISEENTYKRITRAKKILKEKSIKLDRLTPLEMRSRLPSVNYVIYLLFTEGYFSSHVDNTIRKDLCEEAIRLANLVIKSNLSNLFESSALLALMYFHLARMESRQDSGGALVLLEQQDRSLWNTELISHGLKCLEQSTNSESISRYHIEAGIAAQHCLSPSFELTCWENIVTSYEMLERIAPSPLHLLNRAIATAEWKGARAGLAIIQSTKISSWLEHSYHWYSVLADLYFRCGETKQGEKFAHIALERTPSKHIKELLNNRFFKTRS